MFFLADIKQDIEENLHDFRLAVLLLLQSGGVTRTTQFRVGNWKTVFCLCRFPSMSSLGGIGNQTLRMPPLELLQIGGNRLQVIVELPGILLADAADFIDDWVGSHG
jgi:hypothetical protein